MPRRAGCRKVPVLLLPIGKSTGNYAEYPILKVVDWGQTGIALNTVYDVFFCRGMKRQIAIFASCLLWGGVVSAEEKPTPAQINFFEEKIRPVLASKCYKCHSERAQKVKSELLLDSRAAILKGGTEGPSIVVGNPEDSLLITTLRHQDDWEMPPEEKLPDAVVADFAKWIADGAYFPEGVVTKVEKDWWEQVDRSQILPAKEPIERAVDHYVGAKLKADQMAPVAAADDYTYIRRITLDLAGRTPTAYEVRAYVEATEPDKKVKLVDRLLDSDSFERQQATEFLWLLNAGSDDGLREYLTNASAENRSWDRIFRDVILARGDDDASKGAAGFYRQRIGDLDVLTNDVSVRFFGINVSCAQCHDHPEVSSWKQDHYYGMKSFFSRTFDNGGFVAEREYGFVKFKTTAGEEKQAQLMFLSGEAIQEPESQEPDNKAKEAEKKRLEQFKKDKKPVPAPKFSRREQLIHAGLKPGADGFFSRAIVNRLWYRFMGHGLVMPLDQLHGANRPSHPELLEWLARDLVGNQYNLRRTIRGLVLSEAYARGSQWGDSQRPSPSYFAVAQPRPLTPNQYGSALIFASIDPENFKPDIKPEDLRKRIEQYEKSGEGWGRNFQRPEDYFQVSVDEALYFSNNDRVQKDLLGTGGKLVGHLLKLEDRSARLEAAYLNTLSRKPTEAEAKFLGEYLDARKDNEQGAWEQVVWSLMTCAEMRFNR